MWMLNWRALERLTGWATRMDPESTAMWDRGAAGWDKRTAFEQSFTKAQVDALTEITARDTVLDACCGAGRLTIPMARRAKSVTALDAGEQMLGFCAAYARREGLTNVTTLHCDWHQSTPGVDFPKHDIAVACISPAMADVVKFSGAATRYCYFLSFTGPAYRFVMAELFRGCGGPFDPENRRRDHHRPHPGSGQERMHRSGREHMPRDGGKGMPQARREHMHRSGGERMPRDSGLNIPFNILYDLGATPTVNYASGAWEHTAETKEQVLDYLASLHSLPLDAGQRERLAENAAPRMEQLENGCWRYAYPSQMYVLGWDPNQLDPERLARWPYDG